MQRYNRKKSTVRKISKFTQKVPKVPKNSQTKKTRFFQFSKKAYHTKKRKNAKICNTAKKVRQVRQISERIKKQLFILAKKVRQGATKGATKKITCRTLSHFVAVRVRQNLN